jgi:hypothetical protein
MLLEETLLAHLTQQQDTAALEDNTTGDNNTALVLML